MDSYQQQQPAWISASTTEMADRERAFFRSVYSWMTGGLLLTTVAALWVASSPFMQKLVIANPIVMIALMLAELGIVFYASATIQKLSPTAAAVCFLVYSLHTGLTLSIVLFVYSSASIFQAFATAGGMFAVMSVYGRVTKKDLTSWGSFLLMGVFGLIIAMVVNMFIHSYALEMAVSTIGVFVFVGLTAYKTQALRTMAHAGGERAETYAIYGALSLYITFINLFLMLLRLFGGRRR
ncbi:MAG: Bax inhibitor-1/YccA family protein [Acidobacteriota bacterium]